MLVGVFWFRVLTGLGLRGKLFCWVWDFGAFGGLWFV